MKNKNLARTIALVAGFAFASTLAVSAYVLKGYRWPGSSVPYYVNSANLDLDPGLAEAAVRAGADTWASQSDAQVALVYAGATTGSSIVNNSKNEVFFRNESNGTAIATTYSWYSGSNIVDTDVVFWDAAYKFYAGTTGCSGGFYIEDVVAHEFGHALGLAHSGVADATMYATANWCGQDFRSLVVRRHRGHRGRLPRRRNPSRRPDRSDARQRDPVVRQPQLDRQLDERRHVHRRAVVGRGERLVSGRQHRRERRELHEQRALRPARPTTTECARRTPAGSPATPTSPPPRPRRRSRQPRRRARHRPTAPPTSPPSSRCPGPAATRPATKCGYAPANGTLALKATVTSPSYALSGLTAGDQLLLEGGRQECDRHGARSRLDVHDKGGSGEARSTDR